MLLIQRRCTLLSAHLPTPDELDAQSHQGRLPETCYHRTLARGSSGVKRTKYFFGARCVWHGCIMPQPGLAPPCGSSPLHRAVAMRPNLQS